MKENESELLKDLRALAQDRTSEAPPAVRERLLIELRKRRARRRLFARLPVAGIGIAAAVLLLALASGDTRRFLTRPNVPAPVIADAVDADFYPLPEAEGLPPVEQATVIRVEMPTASLQLMGLAVDDEAGSERVQADILLGQDGLARGVRLVQ